MMVSAQGAKSHEHYQSSYGRRQTAAYTDDNRLQFTDSSKDTVASDALPPYTYPSYSMGPMEITLVLMLVCLWLYAARRFYTVWSTVLNFSIAASDRDNGQQKGWDAFIQWALEHIRIRRPTNGEAEDGVNPEHATTSADGAASSVHSTENQFGSGATAVPMMVVRGQENGSSAANESVIISKVGGAANTATTTTVLDLKEVGTASLCESEV